MTDDQSTPLNLDLIQMVQRARMMHDADVRPSEVQGVYWVEFKPDMPVSQPSTRPGFWLIETDTSQIDALWEKIKAQTRAGKLGYKSKASTKPRGGKGDGSQRVICVCTYDRADHADVERVRLALAEIGVTPDHYE